MQEALVKLLQGGVELLVQPIALTVVDDTSGQKSKHLVSDDLDLLGSGADAIPTQLLMIDVALTPLTLVPEHGQPNQRKRPGKA